MRFGSCFHTDYFDQEVMMNANKILVAIDGSESSKRSIDYVAEVMKNCGEYELKLLSIEHLPDRDFFENEDDWKKACIKHRDLIKSILSEGRKKFIDLGIPEDRVHTDYVKSCFAPMEVTPPFCSRGISIAQDILQAAEQEGFGTVVIGRRRVSKAEEFVFGSVSNKIIHSAKNCTVWIVQ